jgi:dolichol kinase
VTTTIPANDEEEEEVATSTASLSTSSSQRNTLRLPFFFRKNSDHKQIAKTLKNRNSVNIRRKVLHAAFGLTFSLLNHMVPRETFLPGMALLSGATLVMELLRYRKGFGWMNDVLHGILGSSLRKHEMDGKFTGSFYFFTGVTLTAYLYPGVPASLGIAQLALADPSASYFGRQTRHVYWSRIENGLGGIGRNKGWLGFLGGALFCFPFNYRVLMLAAKHSSMTAGNVLLTSRSVIVKVSLLLGLAGALADLAVPTPALVLPKKILGVRVPPFHVDDNMVVPIFSALACTKVFDYYGIADLALSKWMVL